ncbi:MAG: hypothetical protein JNM36_11455 [Chitinophagales bacterium]|nr:hypothetical protein [Chitinophagales bacterium]
MLQSARSVSTGDYRFGFNGMEQTKGVQGNGQGNFYDYKNRDYDSWGIRFKRLDPIAAQYPMLSPYQFASNRPIDGIDLDGKEWAIKSVEDGVVTLSLTASVYVPNNIGKIPEKFIEETKVAMEELANNSQWVTNDGQKVRLEVTLNPVDKQKKSTDESEGYYINVVASHHAANGNTESGATTQKAYINLYLNGRESNLVARTLLHETIAHGWSLEHPYVSTSDLYNDYKVAATQVFENMGKRGAKCDKCNAINQNLSTTVQIPPISFNGIPTEGDEENTDYGNALLYNIHFPSNTGPQGTQLLPVQLNKGINQINRQATPPSIPSISINQVKANN